MRTTPLAGAALLIGLCTLHGLRPSPAQPVAVSEAAAPPESTAPPADVSAEARALLAERRWDDAAALLEKALAAGGGTAELHELYGDALVELGRRDEAAHHYDEALRAMLDGGTSSRSSEYRGLRDRKLFQVDPVAQKRTSCINKAVGDLLESCAVLVEHEHYERVLPLLEGLQALTAGDDRERNLELLEEVRKVFSEVDLDAAGEGVSATRRRSVLRQGRHYKLIADLEPAVVDLVADTLDDVFKSYVQVYFDGDESRAGDTKATIRIHADWAQMFEENEGMDPTPGLGGWWSPSEFTVTCYDTRTDSGTLDVMLSTLFHEASHQFMTLLVSRGGWAPAWLNEGTACFFEGARAMADRRVLWPDAAKNRLLSLHHFIQVGNPTLEDLVEWESPASPPGEFYPLCWGLVYFMQEYEDPDTHEYAWRPYYSEYRERMTSEPDHGSRALFEEVFLGPDRPGSPETLYDFAALWRDWIVNEVYPLHYGDNRRERRLERVDRYLDPTSGRSGAGRHELLERALNDVEYLRTEVDAPDDPDPEVILRAIEILRELGRDAAEAAMIEIVLELADRGEHPLDRDEYEELEERMYAIDKANEHPRRAKARIRNLVDRAHRVLEAYEELEEPMPLRTRTFCEELGALLDDQELLARAARLAEGESRSPLAAAGGGVPLDGEGWRRLTGSGDHSFESSPAAVMIDCGDGPAGRLCTGLPLEGEYELRGRLVRAGERASARSAHGVVVHGTEEGPWIVVAVDQRNRLDVRRWYLEDGELDSERLARESLDVEDEDNPFFAIRVLPEGLVRITLEDHEPIEVELDEELSGEAFAGVFAHTARTVLESPRVEQF